MRLGLALHQRPDLSHQIDQMCYFSSLYFIVTIDLAKQDLTFCGFQPSSANKYILFPNRSVVVGAVNQSEKLPNAMPERPSEVLPISLSDFVYVHVPI